MKDRKKDKNGRNNESNKAHSCSVVTYQARSEKTPDASTGSDLCPGFNLQVGDL